eukprot:CAMPEP_0114494540 /NCGR_PEP_ID=MMETSP0109-20121206/4708_1 /TAXON_ID=29199 /ORGANISM="Chlorarachnion reptans, Strain CCCM449" /LENGTH=283 /DNA_ID=CAMNT_0001671587 /DNA_START=250 /DNA_END=1101 /DNA_ORIENTATION=-
MDGLGKQSAGVIVTTLFVGFFTLVVATVKYIRYTKGKSKTPWRTDHIQVDDGGLRAAVFGFSDGVVSNVCLILGVYISIYQETTDAALHAKSVVVTGFAGLFAGACSMACGEWISMVAQKQGLEAELQTERRHLVQYSKEEKKLLKKVLLKHGMSSRTADAVIKDLADKGPEKMLPFHAQMVLGIDTEELGNPWKSAATSFVCFAVGALTPLIPWVFIENPKDPATACKWTAIMVTFAIFAAGSVQAQFSHRGIVWVSLRQLLVVCISATFSMASSYMLSGAV